MKAGSFIFRVAIAMSSLVIYFSRLLRHRFLIEYYGIFFNILNIFPLQKEIEKNVDESCF